MAKEYIMLFDYALYNEDTGEACFNPKMVGELVRCKDCKYCYAEGFVNERNVCEKHYNFENVDDDWFCGDGERRSE